MVSVCLFTQLCSYVSGAHVNIYFKHGAGTASWIASTVRYFSVSFARFVAAFCSKSSKGF